MWHLASIPFQIGSTQCHPLLIFCIVIISELLLVYSVQSTNVISTNAFFFFFLQKIISWKTWINASSLCRKRMLMVWIALLGLFEAVLPELFMWSLLKWTTMNLVSTQKRFWKPPNYWQTQVLHERKNVLSLEIHLSETQEVHFEKQ